MEIPEDFKPSGLNEEPRHGEPAKNSEAGGIAEPETGTGENTQSSQQPAPDNTRTTTDQNTQTQNTQTSPDNSSDHSSSPDSSSGDESTGGPVQDLYKIGKAQQEVNKGQRSSENFEAMKNRYRCNYINTSYCRT